VFRLTKTIKKLCGRHLEFIYPYRMLISSKIMRVLSSAHFKTGVDNRKGVENP